jgi:NAD-dependent dihydropyrimidine dehydrogenase PreA subunit
MSYKSDYCTVCGAMTKLKPSGTFDPNTGKEVMFTQCRTEQCGHSGVDHIWAKGRRKGYLLKQTFCIKCGFCWADYDD